MSMTFWIFYLQYYFLLFTKGTKRDVSNLNGIDGKILTLKNEMSTSLNGVEDNIRKVEKHLFDLLTDSLKDLVDDQQFKISRVF